MSDKFTSVEVNYMQMALALAARAMGRTSPNPMVGAIVVKGPYGNNLPHLKAASNLPGFVAPLSHIPDMLTRRASPDSLSSATYAASYFRTGPENGRVIGAGFHHKAGEPHAEVLALNKLNETDLKDAVLFVTLEPCCHLNKRTPPCTELLISKGIKSVVVATIDPNLAVKGKGIAALRRAGVMVRVGLLKQKAEKLNEVYFKTVNSPLPYVVLKMACSLDGKISTKNGSSRWITNSESRKSVHKLRNIYDAILSSSSTVVSDNPHLGVRHIRGRDPLRIVIDRHLKTSTDALVYRDKNVVVITTNRADKKKMKEFINKKINLKVYPFEFKLEVLLKDLKKDGINSLLIESGGSLASAFVEQKMVDKFVIFYGPILIGNDGIGVLGSMGLNQIDDALRLKDISIKQIKDDIMVEGYF